MLSSLRLIITSALIVGAVAAFSIYFVKFGINMAVIWLANPVLVFLLMRIEERHLYHVFFGGVLGILIANAIHIPNNPQNIIAYTVSNALNVIITYLLIKKYTDRNLKNEYDVPLIVLIIFVGSIISGILAALMLKLPLTSQFVIFGHWVLSKASGMLALLPILILATRKNLYECRRPKNLIKTLMLTLATVIAIHYSLLYSETPLLFIMAALVLTVLYAKPLPAAVISFISIVSVLILLKSGTVAFDQFYTMSSNYSKYLPTLVMSIITFVLVMQKNVIFHKHEFLQYAAERDWLTGLYNRRYFEEIAEQSLQRVRKNKEKKHVVMIIDLDRFKIVNDTVGHLAGDNLLKEVAVLLSRRIRSTDIIARLGGDEFAILMRECTMHDAVDVAKKILAALKQHRFVHGGKSFSISGSIGLANMTCDIPSALEVIDRADIACYESKRHGRETYFVYKESEAKFLSRRYEVDIANAIKESLEKDLFLFYVHRVVALNPDKEDYYEILLRMPFGDKLISAGEFLPVAEKYNLIIDIDRWVVTNLAKNYDKYILPKYNYSINLSGVSLSNEPFVNTLYKIMKSPNVDMSRVQIEITESTLITDIELVKQFITVINAIGGGVVLDDFGQGYSSFHYVHDFDVHSIKVDGAFIREIDEDNNFKIVNSIVKLSADLGILTVAEYVDTEHRLEQVKALGFDYAQGFWKYKPQPLDDLAKELEGTV